MNSEVKLSTNLIINHNGFYRVWVRKGLHGIIKFFHLIVVYLRHNGFLLCLGLI